MSEKRYLADTHILLWALSDDARLTKPHRDILESNAEIIISAASIWEIAIKKSIGKLRVPDNLPNLLPRAGFQILPITAQHADAVSLLPFHHNDPFDRLIIGQAQIEKLPIIGVDKRFSDYNITLI